MATVDELVDQVSRLTSDQKEELLRKAFSPRVVVKSPGVCGGAARIDQTRIPIWGIEVLRRSGAPEEEVLRAFPGLNVLDLANAWVYIAHNREEIDDEIRKNEEI